MKQMQKRSRQAGYMLLSVMLMVTVMLLILTIEAPRIAQQIKREKEEELVHRGKEYAMGIKRFVHKTGRYPTSLEQLEDTNHIRFLRKRYKDPMTIEGEWRLIHQAEAQINFTPAAGTNPGLPGGGLQSSPGFQNTSGFGSTNVGGNGSTTGGAQGGQTGGNQSGFGQNGGSQSGFNQPNGTQQNGTLTVQNLGGGQVGGGAIIGVASMSKATGIKEFNDQTTYDGWLFVYDPRLEQGGGTGIVVAAPRGTTSSSGTANGVQGQTANPVNPAPAPFGAPTPAPQLPQ